MAGFESSWGESIHRIENTMSTSSFEDILDIVGIEIYTYLVPTELFFVSLCNKDKLSDVKKQLFKVCTRHLPLKLGNETDIFISFSKGRSFASKERLIDHVLSKIETAGMRVPGTKTVEESLTNARGKLLGSNCVELQVSVFKKCLATSFYHREGISFGYAAERIKRMLYEDPCKNGAEKDVQLHNFIRDWMFCILSMKQNDGLIIGQWVWQLVRYGSIGRGIMMSIPESEDLIEISYNKINVDIMS